MIEDSKNFNTNYFNRMVEVKMDHIYFKEELNKDLNIGNYDEIKVLKIYLQDKNNTMSSKEDM